MVIVMENLRQPPHPTSTLWDAYVRCGLEDESLVEFAWRIVNPCPDELPNDGGWSIFRSEVGTLGSLMAIVAIEDASTYLNSLE